MTAPAEAQFRTFRDPAGSLTIEADRVVRRVRPGFESSTREFLASNLRQQWEQRGDLVPTSIVRDEATGIELHHPRIWFATYPWEWTLGQWRAAAELTLKLQQEAVAAGWILKDATPLNILFDRSRPVLVDVLSFERRDPQSPVWLAYAQFVRTFLLPLIAHRWLHWPLTATSSRRDGFEPHEIFTALPRLRRFRPQLLWPVTLPVLLEAKADNPESARKARQMHNDPEIATSVLLSSAKGLLKQIRRAAPPPAATAWSKYESTAQHYTAAEISDKQRFVAAALETASPASVLDVGANTGTYSLMAARAGAKVLALEADPAAADRIWQRSIEAALDGKAAATLRGSVLPVIANLAWPTPAYGWENRETHALLDRMQQKFDMVFMLAVVHHLLLHDQVPMENIARLMAKLTRQWLLVEWVPLEDPMFQKLLRGREELYGTISEAGWQTAIGQYFEQLQRQELSNRRVMLLYKLK